MLYLTVFLLMFGAIFMKSIAQLNVVFKAYWLMIPTSMILFTFEVNAFENAITNLDALVCISGGLGAGLGAMAGAWSHKKFVPVGKGYKG